MGDKDTDILFGKPAIFFGEPGGEMKPLKVAGSTRLNPEDAAGLDRLRVREMMQVKSLKIEPLSFDFQMPIDEGLASFIGADFASEPSKEVCSLIIMGEPKINKPRNLKYSNKKRARRVWKKWKRRYGTSPGKTIYLPNVEVESEMANEQYGYPYWRIKAKPIKND